MAITHRRGVYTNFDSAKMVAGEIAVVLSGDPNTDDGKAFYMCFEPGTAKRLASFEDIKTEVVNATDDILVSVYASADRAESAAIEAEQITAMATEAYNQIKEIYDKWKEADVGALQASIDKTKISTTVWVETSTSSTARTVTIDGVTKWDDVLNVPLFIQSKASGVTTATTLNINGLGAKPIVVANLPLWTYAYHVYNVTWNGEALIINNPNIPAASTTQAGKVQLNDTVSSTSTVQAATPNSVKMAYDTAQPEISNYYDSSTGTSSVVTKYNTGIMVITQTITVTRNITNAWGAVYNATSYIGFPDYPVAFIEVWSRNVSPSGGGTVGYWSVSDHMSVAPSLTNVGAYQVARPSSVSSVVVTLTSFTIGTWKEQEET